MVANQERDLVTSHLFRAGRPKTAAPDCPGATSSVALAEKALQAVLAEMPHVLPFEARG